MQLLLQVTMLLHHFDLDLNRSFPAFHYILSDSTDCGLTSILHLLHQIVDGHRVIRQFPSEKESDHIHGDE